MMDNFSAFLMRPILSGLPGSGNDRGFQSQPGRKKPAPVHYFPSPVDTFVTPDAADSTGPGRGGWPWPRPGDEIPAG